MDNRQHSLVLKERTSFSTTGVAHVDNYDENVITVQTTMGILTIKGEGLNINNLNLNEGTLEVSGKVDELIYSENQGKKAKGMLQRIFK
ncbi:MAG: sporulation protein YabP [Clostridia bacterium]|nr:sporulation protein YabP [Clostridia bacterium]